jgi:putative transposase
MPRAHRYSERQIVLVLKEVEAGSATIEEVCRRMQINRRTLYKWRAKFGGLEVGEATRLRQLEDENSRLKHALAEATLDNRALREIVSKKY